VVLKNDDIFPLMMDAIQDQSSTTKRRVATRTLALLVQRTGTVIEPYQRYPDLLRMLLKGLQSEQSVDIRLELLKVLGVLGAIDPHRVRMLEFGKSKGGAAGGLLGGPGAGGDSSKSGGADEALPGPSSEDYYPTVTVTKLVKILNEPSLSSYHQMVIQAVMFIFRTLGLKCVKLLPRMMNLILNLVRSAQQGLRDFLFQQLGLLVSIIKQYIRPYLDKVFLAIHDFWDQEALQPQMLFLIGEIATALRDEFKDYIPKLIPKMLSVLSRDAACRRSATCIKVLLALERLDANLERYLDVTIPAVMAIAEQEDANLSARIAAIQWIGRTCRRLNVLEFASPIIHPLARLLDGNNAALHRPAVLALSSLMQALNQDFVLFAPLLTKCVGKRRDSVDAAPRFLLMLDKLKRKEPVQYTDIAMDELTPAGAGEGAGGWPGRQADASSTPGGARRNQQSVNQQQLKRSWQVRPSASREDWSEWLRRFSVELLRESPSPALRSCAAPAQVYHPLARELFNAAFTSCWSELYESNRESLMRSLELAFSEENGSNVPPEVLQTLLALAEFMEHDERPLPIGIRLLGNVAERCQAYAKSLHYKEMQFLTSPETAIHSLISVNNHLGQTEAANGLVHMLKSLILVAPESNCARRLMSEALRPPARPRAQEGSRV
jgi:FKBP12-rapamycin complex-associated protein